jgi:hypothetical protein
MKSFCGSLDRVWGVVNGARMIHMVHLDHARLHLLTPVRGASDKVPMSLSDFESLSVIFSY